MTRDRMLIELRDRIGDTVQPYFWSDDFLLGVLAEGQDEFCEQTGYFRDVSNFTVTLETGKAAYAISDRIIEILAIWDGTRKLGKFQETQRAFVSQEWDPATSTEQSGRPRAWQTDRETGLITFDRTPTAAENGAVFQIHAWRYSLYSLDGDGPVPEVGETPVAEPEIPSRFHRACIEWAAHKAYGDHDSEKSDPIKSSRHKAEFDDYVKKGRFAMQRGHGLDVRVGTSPAYRT